MDWWVDWADSLSWMVLGYVVGLGIGVEIRERRRR